MNAESLRGPAREGVAELILISHLRRQRRATFRDLRSALAWMITGDRSCDDVHRSREEGIDLTKDRRSLFFDLAFDGDAADDLVREWATIDPSEVSAPEVEREFRHLGLGLKDRTESRNLLRSLQRRIFFRSATEPADLHESVLSYRFLTRFKEALQDPGQDNFLDDVLLGISRIAGAPGYDQLGLAIASRLGKGIWAVLKIVDRTEFELSARKGDDSFVEAIPEFLELRNQAGAKLEIPLDTFELILRAANGELLNDPYSDALRQEIEGFAAQLYQQPSAELILVDPFGTKIGARREGSDVILEKR